MTLKDIGEILDKAMAKELLESGLEYDPILDVPKYYKTDIKPENFRWNTRFFADFEKVEAGYIEDMSSQFDDYPMREKYKKHLLNDLKSSIEYEDRH